MEESPDTSYLDETTETLLEQSQQNAQGLILATISVLDDLGLLPEAWADAVAERFSVAWGMEEPWEPAEFLDAMLTNYRALGAVVDELDAEGASVSAVVSGFPDDELLELFGVTAEDAATFHRVAAAIARPRGLDWRWELLGDGQTRFTVETRAE
ncbi:MAG: hypothetical protein IT334_11835 [Thermomicrobiales bacterium]|nr:hypothetical protein [Thermomicrobiales bacterium]